MEGGHVVLSYEWESRDMLIRVRDQLKQAGYRIWMDTENKSKLLLYFN